MRFSSVCYLLFIICSGALIAQDRPNILWLFQEDTSPWMDCYGYESQKKQTPNITRLADQGVLFTRAYVPHPVCSTCRSAMMVGANTIRFGAQEHQSKRGAPFYLPKGMKTLPELFRDKGYFTFNAGKTDYNFLENGNGIYSARSKDTSQKLWRECPEGQSFFGQIQLKGGKINIEKSPPKYPVDPSKVIIPADCPQNALYRKFAALHYNTIRRDDEVIGGILKSLEEDGLLDSTIIVYFSDHGAKDFVRYKHSATEGGLHVPFIIKGPSKWVPSDLAVREDLISTLDLCVTTLVWAGIPVPEWCEGKDLFAENYFPHTFVASARDRMDHTIDRVRTIRTDRFRYTRNYELDRIFLQPIERDDRDYTIYLREAYADGSLDPKLAEIYFGERPAEELHDMQADLAQLNNLAMDPAYAVVLQEHRDLLDEWLAGGDAGEFPEADEELIMHGQKHGKPRGVNPEYERIREDSDGDGLSDEWEILNARDPKDGRLIFTFDCGGWQTEGWKVEGDTSNIPGRLGFLDFDLLEGQATLVRDGLKVNADNNKDSLKMRVRSDSPAKLMILANGASLGELEVDGSNKMSIYSIPLKSKVWKKVIEELRIEIVSKANASLEIDWIKAY